MSASTYLPPESRSSAPATRWADLGDFGLLLLIIAASTGCFVKLGLGSPAWGLVYLGTLWGVARHFDGVIGSVQLSWPLLIFPAICLASVMWSVEPMATLRHTFQYLFTFLIAIWAGSRFTLPVIFRAMTIALIGCVTLSVAASFGGIIEGFKQDDYVGAESYFVGLYGQKNVMGITIVYASIGALVTGALTNRKLLCAALVVLMLPVLIMTKSTTALLLYLVACTFYPAFWFFTESRYRLPLVLAAVVLALLGLFLAMTLDIALVNEFLGLLGKDATLTGRTVIWDKGFELFWRNPAVGVGYQALWESPLYVNDVMLIRAAVLESIGGFHNGYLETMVGLGALGMLGYCILVLTGLLVTLRTVTKQLTIVTMGSFYVAGIICSRTFTESALYFQHDLELILLIMIAVSTLKAAATDLLARRS